MAANRSITQFLLRFRALNGTVALYGASISLAYAFNILMARWSGPMEFGRYLIVWNLIAWTMTLASLGTSVAAVRFIPQYESAGDDARLGGFLVLSVLATAAVSIVLGVAGTAMSVLNAFPVLKSLGSMLGPFWILLITVNLGNLASEFARAGKNPWMAVGPQGVMRPALALALIAISSIAGAAQAKVTTTEILTALALSGILALLVQGGYLFRRFKQNLQRRKIYESRRWLRASLQLCMFSTAVGGLMQLDTLMAGILIGPVAAGVFGVDYRVGLAMEIPLAIANILVAPVLSALFARREMIELQRSTTRVSLLIFSSSIVIILGVLIFAAPILRLFGSQFVIGLTPLRWVAIGAAASAAFGPVAFLVIITDLQSVGLIVLIATGIIDVTASVLLVPIFGLTGVALAYVVSNVFRSLALYVVLKKMRGVTSGIFYRAGVA